MYWYVLYMKGCTDYESTVFQKWLRIHVFWKFHTFPLWYVNTFQALSLLQYVG